MGGGVRELLPRPHAGRLALDLRLRRAFHSRRAVDHVAPLRRVSHRAARRGVPRSRFRVRGARRLAASLALPARPAAPRRLLRRGRAAQERLLRRLRGGEADITPEPAMTTDRIGLQIRTSTGPGVLHQLTGVIAQQRGDISSVAIASQSAAEDRVYLEIDLPGRAADLVAALQQLDVVRGVEVVDTLKTIYGQRVIIMGGGAPGGQVARRAIS